MSWKLESVMRFSYLLIALDTSLCKMQVGGFVCGCISSLALEIIHLLWNIISTFCPIQSWHTYMYIMRKFVATFLYIYQLNNNMHQDMKVYFLLKKNHTNNLLYRLYFYRINNSSSQKYFFEKLILIKTNLLQLHLGKRFFQLRKNNFLWLILFNLKNVLI